jgi:hypothetical protein
LTGSHNRRKPYQCPERQREPAQSGFYDLSHGGQKNSMEREASELPEKQSSWTPRI